MYDAKKECFVICFAIVTLLAGSTDGRAATPLPVYRSAHPHLVVHASRAVTLYDRPVVLGNVGRHDQQTRDVA